MDLDLTSGDAEATRSRILLNYPVESAGLSEQLDEFAALAAQLCDAPVGLVSWVGTDSQTFIGRAGTSLEGTAREHSFCAHAMYETECMIVPDATRDLRFRQNPLVTGEPYIRFYAGQPLKSEDGVPLGALCVTDTKPRDGLTQQQRKALSTLGKAVVTLLERERVEASSDSRKASFQSEIDELSQRFESLANAMPQLVWSTDAEGMSDYFNKGWCDFVGQPAEASYGARWLEFVHPEDLGATEQCWRAAVAEGQPYESEYRLRNGDGEYRWFIARGLPIKGAAGQVVRWVGTCTDINEQKDDAQRLTVLSRELNHRIKNIFAVIGGLIAMTIRQSPDFADTAEELRDRILALGRAHDFVRSHNTDRAPHPHTSFMGMLDSLLAPYQNRDGTAIRIIGEDLPIDDRSATPLALFFHELATNAVKYGALSVEQGRVLISVSKGERVSLTWKESGGPQVTEPTERGFGSTLVEMSIKRQLGGDLTYNWHSDGLEVQAAVPLRSLIR